MTDPERPTCAGSEDGGQDSQERAWSGHLCKGPESEGSWVPV